MEFNLGKFKVKIVDGKSLRDRNPDFTNYGHHQLFSEIPENEVWIDSSSKPEELSFFILRALYECMLYDRGLAKDEVSSAGKALDKNLRNKIPTEPIHVRKLLDFGDLHVWAVQGDQVRKQHDPNFIMGGHGYVYDYVPKDEVWIEDALPPRDKTFTLLHELYEIGLMREGRPYNSAHEETTYIEKKLRNLVSN